MSTLCHIIIRQQRKQPIIIAHPGDGYPFCVGEDLCNFFNKHGNETIDEITNGIIELDEYYRLEDDFSNIPYDNYLYFIDMDSRTIKCLSTYDSEGLKLDYVFSTTFDTPPEEVVCDISCNRQLSMLAKRWKDDILFKIKQ